MDSTLICLVAISLDSALIEDGNYCPQVVLKECKYIKKVMIRNILGDKDFSWWFWWVWCRIVFSVKQRNKKSHEKRKREIKSLSKKEKVSQNKNSHRKNKSHKKQKVSHQNKKNKLKTIVINKNIDICKSSSIWIALRCFYKPSWSF